jgi:hypothetical protein
MSIGPQPGMYLFVGGIADGQMRQVDIVYDELRVHVPQKFNYTPNELGPKPGNSKMDIENYHLSSMYGEKETFYLYLHASMNGDDLIKRLFKNYGYEL